MLFHFRPTGITLKAVIERVPTSHCLPLSLRAIDTSTEDQYAFSLNLVMCFTTQHSLGNQNVVKQNHGLAV